MLACTSFDLKTKCSGISSPILTKYFLDPSATRKFLFVIPPLMEEIFILFEEDVFIKVDTSKIRLILLTPLSLIRL